MTDRYLDSIRLGRNTPGMAQHDAEPQIDMKRMRAYRLGRMQAQLMRAPYHAKPFKQHPFQLELSQMICIPPGTSAQQLHQDIGKHVFDFRGMLEPRRPCARLCSRTAPGAATVCC